MRPSKARIFPWFRCISMSETIYFSRVFLRPIASTTIARATVARSDARLAAACFCCQICSCFRLRSFAFCFRSTVCKFFRHSLIFFLTYLFSPVNASVGKHRRRRAKSRSSASFLAILGYLTRHPSSDKHGSFSAQSDFEVYSCISPARYADNRCHFRALLHVQVSQASRFGLSMRRNWLETRVFSLCPTATQRQVHVPTFSCMHTAAGYSYTFTSDHTSQTFPPPAGYSWRTSLLQVKTTHLGLPYRLRISAPALSPPPSSG